jgi:zinc protease
VGPFHDPGLLEFGASARNQHTAEELLGHIDAELKRVCSEPVTDEELERALSRLELGLVSSLETVDGKASTIGFFDTILAEPAAAFSRLQAMRRVSQSDIIRVARRYLNPDSRTCVFVRSETPTLAEGSE